jgi:membrane associated rhomboid family serine protease
MAGLKEEIKRLYQEGDALSRLIGVLLAVYVVIVVLNIFSTLLQIPLSNWVISYLVLPSDLSKWIWKPWTMITYMFVHQDFFHILFNLLYLYFAGRLFQEYVGGKRLISTFILGGIAGGLLYVLSYNLFPFFSETVLISNNRGASAGVMAILIAAATFTPSFPIKLFFVLEIKFWQLAAILLLLDLVYLPESNAGGHLAHIGGALYGYIMARQWKEKGININAFFEDTVESFFSKRKKSKLKVSYSRKENSATSSSISNQQKLDVILDKISKGGYESLSKEEKDFLFKMSK